MTLTESSVAINESADFWRYDYTFTIWTLEQWCRNNGCYQVCSRSNGPLEHSGKETTARY
jgi:hypothetical protein